jgi:DNA-binding response OmpR family regulator
MAAKYISQAGELASATVQGEPNPPYRILVADDEPIIRQLNTGVLIDAGYHVSTVEDGAVAWDTLQLNRYNLLITENEISKVSGVELLKNLYAARMALPVILIAGAMPSEELKRYPWLQIDAMLLKPYTIAELLVTVRNVLYATYGAREQIAPPPNWQSHPGIPRTSTQNRWDHKIGMVRSAPFRRCAKRS